VLGVGVSQRSFSLFIQIQLTFYFDFLLVMVESMQVWITLVIIELVKYTPFAIDCKINGNRTYIRRILSYFLHVRCLRSILIISLVVIIDHWNRYGPSLARELNFYLLLICHRLYGFAIRSHVTVPFSCFLILQDLYTCN